MKKHLLNLAAVLVGIALFFFGCWQIDMIAAPYIWNNLHDIEVLPKWIMRNGTAYVMFFCWIFIGLLLVIVGLWFWTDENVVVRET